MAETLNHSIWCIALISR